MAKKRRRWPRYLAAVLVVVLAIGVGVKVETDRIDVQAEAFAGTGKAAIGLFSDYQAAFGKLDLDGVLACYDADYANESEGYWAEQLRSDRDGIRVCDWQLDGRRPFGRSDVAEQLARYFKDKAAIAEAKCKLDAVEAMPRAGAAVVRSILWLRGTTTSGETFECHTLFRMWLRAGDGGWKIHKQELLSGETVTGDRSGFTDVTASCGIDFQSHHNPLWRTAEWEPKKFGIIKYGSAGVAAADYDNDGWYDVFICDGKKPRLYHNNGDGTFTDVTVKAGLPDELCGCNVAIFADLNNDGYKDLFLGLGTGLNRLYRNNGDGTFTDVTEGAGLGGYWVTVAAAADYDNDGRIDLYLGRYLDARTKLPTTLFYTRNGEGNTLLHNDGNFHFHDVTAQAGVREGGLTLGVAWGDYDGDGYQDLFVANDFGRNALFHNNGDGTFTDVSQQTGALDFGYSMSACFGDINNDGHLDIYVSKVHSAQRWYGQAATMHKYLLTSARQRTLGEDAGVYRELYGLVGSEWQSFGDRTIRGNSLLLNDGTAHFHDVAETAHANPFGWYWGSAMFDFDNDGLQDIIAANGWISGRTKDDL
jgi:hypothetical protein